jgi:hypothetical protein
MCRPVLCFRNGHFLLSTLTYYTQTYLNCRLDHSSAQTLDDSHLCHFQMNKQQHHEGQHILLLNRHSAKSPNGGENLV